MSPSTNTKSTKSIQGQSQGQINVRNRSHAVVLESCCDILHALIRFAFCDRRVRATFDHSP